MYLKKPLPFKVRQSFALLRCSTAPLRIETGRYENINAAERFCEICNTNDVEDEIHFFITCNAHQQERHKLFMYAEQIIEDYLHRRIL